MRISIKWSLCCLAALILIGTASRVFAQAAPAPKPAANEGELLRMQMETEKLRQDLYRAQTQMSKSQSKTPDPANKSFSQKLFDDPADTVGEFGAVIGLIVGFLYIVGNRGAERRYRRDIRFHEALGRFGDGGTPAARCASAGLLAQMGKAREGRGCPYLDTAASQLIAGYRLEENEAVRQAVVDALRELIAAEPFLVRRKLSDAGIKLPGD